MIAERWARGGLFEPDTQGTIMSGMRQREPGRDGLTVAPYRHSATPELTMPSGAMEGKVPRARDVGVDLAATPSIPRPR